MPGTGLPREAPAPIRFIANHVFPHVIPLLRRVYLPNVHTVEESGDALGGLVTDPELADTTHVLRRTQGNPLVRRVVR